jgi:outer membrane receptor protein involved in Fe transport
MSIDAHANPQLGDVNYITRNKSDFDDYALFGELTWNVTDKWQVTGGVRAFKQDFAVDLLRRQSARRDCGQG